MDSRESDEGAALARTATADGASAPLAPVTQLEPGDSLGRYTILETLGEGGMGVVYGAYDPDLDRKVALKLLRVHAGEGTASDAARARLLREARAIAKVSHPNVITVYEVGTVGLTDFVAMEFVDGESLADWLEQEHHWRDVLEVFLLAGRGLAAAHRAGLIHRDFKPANVLLGRDGRVRVTDFGLARLASEEVLEQVGRGTGGEPTEDLELAVTMSPRLTQTGAILGTPAYMAPEQHDGHSGDERTDQFSYCVALHEGLYRQRPFGGNTLEALRKATTSGEIPDEPRGSSVPAWVRRAVVRGLSPDASQRHDSMDELLASLSHDPVALRRRFIAFGSAGMVSLGLIALLATRGDRPEEAQVCADGPKALNATWGDESRQRLERAFQQSAGSAGVASFVRFSAVVDAYADKWLTIYKDACTATRVRRERTEPDLHLHMGCLLERRKQLASMLQVFASPDADAIEQSVQAAQALPQLDECGDLDALRRGVTPPPAAKAATVDAARQALAKAKAMQDARRYLKAREHAEAGLELAEQSSYTPVLSEALYRLGRLHYFLDEPKPARKRLERAALLADMSGYDEIRARCLVALVQTDAAFSSDNDATRRRAVIAEAVIRRHGRSPVLQARLWSSLGMLLAEEGDYAAAFARFRRAHEQYQKARGSAYLASARPLRAMANIHEMQGDRVRSLELKRKALAILEGQLRGNHPRVVRAKESIAETLRTMGKYAEARAIFAKTAGFWRTPRGKELLAQVGHGFAPAPKGKRMITGRVLDPDGKPVTNAAVVTGSAFFGDGRYLDARSGGVVEHRLGVVRGRTDAEGKFELGPVRFGEVLVAAEVAGVGRSPMVIVKGNTNVETELRLVRTGSIMGTVASEGEAGGNVVVSAVPAELMNTLARIGFAVHPDDEGRFRIDNLAAGDYEIYAGAGDFKSGRNFISRKVTIRPGETTKLDLDMKGRGVGLDVIVRGIEGPAEAAQVFVFDRKVDVRNAGDLNKAFAVASKGGAARMAFTKPRRARGAGLQDDPSTPGDPLEIVSEKVNLDKHVPFTDVAPGERSVCVIPIHGDIKDPQFAKKLMADVESLPTYCRQVTVAKTPLRQTLEFRVPRSSGAPRIAAPPRSR